MKKSILSASIAAMVGGLTLAGAAQAAVFVQPGTAATGLGSNDTGIGHILLVPYFTTQGTNATLLNITNTDTANAKIVKVRFRGASNSDDLFDFTLLLSPGDVWAAKVSQNASGVSQLETSDKSCTLPSIVGTQVNAFGTSRLNPALTAAQLANETREGYVEILTMADVPKASNAAQRLIDTSLTAAMNSPMWTAIKHVNGVAPCTAATLAALGTDPITFNDLTSAATATTSAQGKGMTYPTTGLMANYTIIDTVKTATFSGAATALQATGGTANLVFFPQSGATFVSSQVSNGVGTTAVTGINGLTADPLLVTTSLRTNPTTLAVAAGTSSLVTPTNVDLPDLSTPYYATGAATEVAVTPIAQAFSLTNALAADAVINEFLTTTSIAATTDWVFSMPTRRYNVALDYSYKSPLGGDGRVYTDFGAGLNFFTSANTSLSGGKICVAANAVTQRDREETTTTAGFVISPATVTTISFCGETSVLGINNGTNTSTGSLNASVAAQNINVSANEGWLNISTLGLDNAGAWPGTAATAAATSRGLPVVGAAFAKSSAFGASWPHRYTR